MPHRVCAKRLPFIWPEKCQIGRRENASGRGQHVCLRDVGHRGECRCTCGKKWSFYG